MRNSTQHCLSVILVATVLVSGCQRSRLFSRNDYADMHDPFMESGASLAASSGDQSPGSDGVARLDARRTASALPSQRPLPSASTALTGGPKPIHGTPSTTAGRFDVPVARATYPGGGISGDRSATTAAYPGPALSDFLGTPETAAKTAAAAAPASQAKSPAIRELNEFARFVDSSTPPPQTAATPPTSNSLPPSGPAFTEWIAEQKKQWEIEQPVVGSAASDPVSLTAPTGTAEAFTAPTLDGLPMLGEATLPATAAGIARQPQDSLLPSAQAAAGNSLSGQNPFSGLAAPSSAAPAVAVDEAAPQIIPAGASNDPFVNPFAMSSGTSDTARTSAAAQDELVAEESPASGRLDSAFQMDSGWKPSSLIDR